MKIEQCRRCESYTSLICKGNRHVKRREDCDGFRESGSMSIPIPLDLDFMHSVRKMRKRINGEESEDNIRENIAILLSNCLEEGEMRRYYDRFKCDDVEHKFYLEEIK